MPIASDRPETGVRIAIERDARQNDPPWTYRGSVHLPDRSIPLEVVVGGDGAVSVALEEAELAEKVRLIVRTVVRQAEGDPPAWRIVRWRGEK